MKWVLRKGIKFPGFPIILKMLYEVLCLHHVVVLTKQERPVNTSQSHINTPFIVNEVVVKRVAGICDCIAYVPEDNHRLLGHSLK